MVESERRATPHTKIIAQSKKGTGNVDKGLHRLRVDSQELFSKAEAQPVHAHCVVMLPLLPATRSTQENIKYQYGVKLHRLRRENSAVVAASCCHL